MIKIYIEGKEKRVPESDFLSSVLSHIGIPQDKYEIIHTGGFTNLLDSDSMPYVGLLRANTDDGGMNLVIFDADTDKNKGGFTVRREYLLTKRDQLDLKFDLFLWPNNREDGDVEVLMESIARKDLYPEFFDCFTKYEHCMSLRKNDKGEPFYSTPNRKGKLHTYFHALPISNTKKNRFGQGVWRWSDELIWDLEADSLNPIKGFLLKYLEK